MIELLFIGDKILSEKEGVIAKINAGEGDSLAVDAIILELE